jgi:hypothetical protein
MRDAFVKIGDDVEQRKTTLAQRRKLGRKQSLVGNNSIATHPETDSIRQLPIANSLK